MKYYAHTKKRADGSLAPEEEWEPLYSEDCGTLEGKRCDKCEALDPQHGHLNKVAYLAGKFAEEMFPEGSEEARAAREWGRLAGLWHDLGKFAPEWQEYLKRKASDLHGDEISGTVDHSTAGAQWAVKAHPLFGHPLAYGIAAHHCGLLDVQTEGKSCQEARIAKEDIADYSNAPRELTEWPIPEFPPFLMEIMKRDRNGFSAAFYTRMLFSCLVDSDFLATESYMNARQAAERNAASENYIKEIDTLVAKKIDSFGEPAASDIVNYQRAKVAADCRRAALLKPGLFTLTVPTGGGKTLSSLQFATRHALEHGQKRIIYVVPFTSIIEQNAEVIRSIVAPLQSQSFTPLVEHHSSLSPEKESTQSRLAAENWDAPIVITTSVQFFESLFASKTSRNRKLHNIANAIVILDEAQTLPVNFLKPCLRVLQELSDHYNTSLVLCTATQPAIQYDRDEFSIGLQGCREIIEDPVSLFDTLKRVVISNLGMQSDEQIVERMQECDQCLCVVNRRKHAQEVFRKLADDGNRYHLSALMCPEHRSEVLVTIRKRLDDGLPVRLVSTQLIEAGVDVDFPVVYRSLAGLDSIAQAAGRCNRNGKLKDENGDYVSGKAYTYQAEDQQAETYFRETAQVAAQIIDLHDDLLGEEAIRRYFDLYYYRQKERWDEKRIVDSFRFDGRVKHCPFRFDFETVAKNFKLIDDWQRAIIVPYDVKARGYIDQLRNESIPLNRGLLRALQRYTVQIPPRLLEENGTVFESLRDEQFYVLISPELNYSPEFGLMLDEEYSGSKPLIL